MTTGFQFTDDRSPPADDAALIVRIPAGLNRKRRLLAAYYGQLRLPEYFGWNWDALEECLRDLSWLPGIERVIVVHRDVPFGDAPENRETYLSILRDRAGETNPGMIPFEVRFPVGAQGDVAQE